ncbi:Lcl domain-containing protein [Micavibrio aeruginosavorus]|uniref:Conserved domain protein n=1 Tax=Micavibrio aeruginosavorus (strain ARL-13) TaxID=856793 RepID=G2KNY7_MICAA|nr:DUF1566 domain-containing protein [Micavibrio aeruginosavorus]AEP08495.1 conserved domain protein [Micavibrio aeruginosavorus ARL-13]
MWRAKTNILFLGLVLGTLLGAGPAHAACVSPAGDAGDLIWSSASNAPAYCNDTDWVGFPSGTFGAFPGALSQTINNPPAHSSNSDFFGARAAIDGNLIVVGAHLEDPSAIVDAGQAYVFDATTGALVSTLLNPNPTSQDYFGISVAISGNLAIVGAYQDDPGGVTSAGTAYVFNATTGALVATLNKTVPASYDLFGISVGISGNLAVVGAYHDDPSGVSFAGAAYVFNATTGGLITTLTNPAMTASAFFGNSVAISGNLVAVGAYQDDPGGVANAGTAHVFNATTGALVTTLVQPGAEADDSFGSSVAISGNTVVVAANKDHVSGVDDVGTVYTFNATTGALMATLNNPTPTANESFPTAVAIDGNTVIAGSNLENISGNSNAGAAYVFDATTGDLLKSIDNPTPAVNAYFGSAVGVSDSIAVVSGYGFSSGAGRAFTFVPDVSGAGCVAPAGAVGDIFYNMIHHVLQYCDGSAWRAAGPTGNGGAGCVNPAGDAGDVVYNSTHNYLQYCEGDDWIGIGRKDVSEIPPTGCPVIGNTCNDGSIYAGLTPDGNVPMYAAASNAPTQMNWNNGTSNNIDTAIVNCTSGAQSGCDTGEANTILLAGLVNAASPYEAATYCSNLVAHGRSDWYLPALNELQLLYTNLYLGGFGGLTNHDYWSSSEQSDDSGKNIYFGDGNTYNGGKSNDFRVRCVRK